MKKNILRENMKRFNTKNLHEGAGDVMWLNDNKAKIETMLTTKDPELKVKLGKEVKADGEKANFWGVKYTAEERLLGAVDSLDSIKGLVKGFIPDDADPINMEEANSILSAVLGSAPDSKILNGIRSLAKYFGVEVIE
tara:strand:- start:4 stop:417 length:414 start_codon:yes stop_codon:yes gene_type:complete